jgi:hypothetical protein
VPLRGEDLPRHHAGPQETLKRATMGPLHRSSPPLPDPSTRRAGGTRVPR